MLIADYIVLYWIRKMRNTYILYRTFLIATTVLYFVWLLQFITDMDSVAELAPVAQIMQRRQQHLLKACKNYVFPNNFKLFGRTQRIRIHRERKLLYCSVPKISSGSLGRAWLAMSNFRGGSLSNITVDHAHGFNHFESVTNVTDRELQEIINTYTKIIFVRHPFARLLSAYRDKVEKQLDASKLPYLKRYGLHILSMYRSNTSIFRGDETTFAEFARYAGELPTRKQDGHWISITDICHPCFIRYDFIGKFETLHRDSEFIFKHVMKVDFALPNFVTSNWTKPPLTSTMYREYYSTLPSSILHNLSLVYKYDFSLFNYTPNEVHIG